MGHDWILDVLTDLRAFASANDLPSLAAHLDDATKAAQTEIASRAEGHAVGLAYDRTAAGRFARASGIR